MAVEEEPASEPEPKVVLQLEVGSESLEPQTVGNCTYVDVMEMKLKFNGEVQTKPALYTDCDRIFIEISWMHERIEAKVRLRRVQVTWKCINLDLTYFTFMMDDDTA